MLKEGIENFFYQRLQSPVNEIWRYTDSVDDRVMDIQKKGKAISPLHVIADDILYNAGLFLQATTLGDEWHQLLETFPQDILHVETLKQLGTGKEQEVIDVNYAAAVFGVALLHLEQAIFGEPSTKEEMAIELYDTIFPIDRSLLIRKVDPRDPQPFEQQILIQQAEADKSLSRFFRYSEFLPGEIQDFLSATGCLPVIREKILSPYVLVFDQTCGTVLKRMDIRRKQGKQYPYTKD